MGGTKSRGYFQGHASSVLREPFLKIWDRNEVGYNNARSLNSSLHLSIRAAMKRSLKKVMVARDQCRLQWTERALCSRLDDSGVRRAQNLPISSRPSKWRRSFQRKRGTHYRGHLNCALRKSLVFNSSFRISFSTTLSRRSNWITCLEESDSPFQPGIKQFIGENFESSTIGLIRVVEFWRLMKVGKRLLIGQISFAIFLIDGTDKSIFDSSRVSHCCAKKSSWSYFQVN